jgi:hypothetical protein
MAEELTQEQIDAQAAAQAAAEAERRAYEEGRETLRFERELLKEEKRIRLEVVRLAKETLIENNRHKAVDERDVSAEDITAFANVLYNYTNE